ncbi:hypothetical protein PN462_15860 [Spirulina sp. CS-785/01]|uniref:Npun_R2821/Npun_R2822 family protein n=1 Tax=Spirulina sp. CS-785/01 TaxID=3021716 RepID=UPI00232F1585|nr:Npun_R2821/Npun_R2822 family protein [Spirulina sp. CS-785/01]MDB9314587.1 hypothetical protein [Spirulina sp. CS-785/01]
MNVKPMKPLGIYTLANDLVFNQLVAFLNSVEVNISSTIPICIIPFDDQLERIKQEIASRPNVSIFPDQNILKTWENFACAYAQAHPEARGNPNSHPRWYQGKLHRRFAAFHGIFEQFVYFDADSLVMKPIDDVLDKLTEYDFVFDDWEHTKLTPYAALNIPLIEETKAFSEAEIRPKLHCSSFWGSKRGLFPAEELATLQDYLVNRGEAVWINRKGWWDDAYFFNYLTLRCERPLFNFTLSSNSQDRTGNCADADPFQDINHILYNAQGLKPIHRLHYMGFSEKDFVKLVQGIDVGIPYKEVFLHYRFLKNPQEKPMRFRSQRLWVKLQRWMKMIQRKLRQ